MELIELSYFVSSTNVKYREMKFIYTSMHFINLNVKHILRNPQINIQLFNMAIDRTLNPVCEH